MGHSGPTFYVLQHEETFFVPNGDRGLGVSLSFGGDLLVNNCVV